MKSFLPAALLGTGITMAANVAADKPSMVPTQLESIDRKLDRIEEGIDMLDNEIQARCRPPELKFPACTAG